MDRISAFTELIFQSVGQTRNNKHNKKLCSMLEGEKCCGEENRAVRERRERERERERATEGSNILNKGLREHLTA